THTTPTARLAVRELTVTVRCRAQHSTQGSNNIASASHFRRAVKERHFAVGDYPLQNRAERSGIHFAYPILNDQGNITAVIFAALDLLWVQQLAAEHKLPEGVALSIVDSKGTLLARFPEAEKWVGKHIPDASLFEMLQLRSQISRDLVGLDGVDRLYALKPLLINRSGEH